MHCRLDAGPDICLHGKEIWQEMKLQDKVLFNGKGANLLKSLISLNILWWYCSAPGSASLSA